MWLYVPITRLNSYNTVTSTCRLTQSRLPVHTYTCTYINLEITQKFVLLFDAT